MGQIEHHRYSSTRAGVMTAAAGWGCWDLACMFEERGEREKDTRIQAMRCDMNKDRPSLRSGVCLLCATKQGWRRRKEKEENLISLPCPVISNCVAVGVGSLLFRVPGLRNESTVHIIYCRLRVCRKQKKEKETENHFKVRERKRVSNSAAAASLGTSFFSSSPAKVRLVVQHDRGNGAGRDQTDDLNRSGVFGLSIGGNQERQTPDEDQTGPPSKIEIIVTRFSHSLISAEANPTSPTDIYVCKSQHSCAFHNEQASGHAGKQASKQTDKQKESPASRQTDKRALP